MTDLPRTMRALTLTGDGYSGTAEGPVIADARAYLAVSELPVPALKEGEALIRMKLSPVNPSDLHFIKGEYGASRVQGAPAGFEGVGEVVAGDTPLLGQRVSVAGAGIGAWAEYCVAPTASLIPCHPALSDTDAAAQIVNPLTALALFEIGQRGGAMIITAALSQLGRMMLAEAKAAGTPAIAVLRRAEQAEEALSLGATDVIVTTSAWEAGAAKTIASLKPRALIDAVGDQATAQLFGMMPGGAVWTSYGKLSAETPTLDALGHLIFMGKRIEGFWLTRWFAETPRENIAETVQTVQTRFINGTWNTQVGETLSLEEALTGLPRALSGPGKMFIAP